MPKVQFVDLFKQIVFHSIQLLFHIIFWLLAQLPDSIFEGSPLQKWTPLTSQSRRCRRGRPSQIWEGTFGQIPVGCRIQSGTPFTRRSCLQGRRRTSPPCVRTARASRLQGRTWRPLVQFTLLVQSFLRFGKATLGAAPKHCQLKTQ